LNHQNPVTVEEFSRFFDSLDYPVCPVCGGDQWNLFTFDGKEAAVLSDYWHALLCEKCGYTHFHAKHIVEQWRDEHA